MEYRFIQVSLLAFMFSSLVWSCKGADDLETKIIVPVLQIDNFTEGKIKDCSEIFVLDHIKISPAVAMKIKTKGFLDFFVADSSVFVVNSPDAISKINFSGDMLWQLVSGSKEFNIFNSLGVAIYNPFTKLIEVQDNMKTKDMEFDLDGNFVRQYDCNIDYSGKVNLTNKTDVYGVASYSNSHLRDDDYHFDLIKVDETGEYSFLKQSPSIQRGQRAFVDLNTFERMDGAFFFHKEFSDTVFNLTENEIVPSFTVNFSGNGNAQNIINDSRIVDKVPAIIGQNIPFIDEATANAYYYFILYYSGSSGKMLIAKKTGETVVNSSFIRVDNMLLPASKNYTDGYFITVLSDKENTFLQQKAKEIEINVKALKEEYEELQATDTDLGSLHYYLLKVR